MKRSFVLSCVGLLVCRASVIDAQALRGRVIDAKSRDPIAAVRLRLLRGDTLRVAEVMTDDSGRFILRANQRGTYRITTERIGYAPSTLGPISLNDEGTTDIQISMDVRVVPLKALVVTTEARVRSLEQTGFYARKKLGFGKFLDRTDIEKRATSKVTELLQGVPGVRILPRRDGKYDVLLRGGVQPGIHSTGRNGICLPRVFLNGMVVALGNEEFDWERVFTHDLEAIEIYRSPAEVPAQYGGAQSACGVVLLWMRFGG